MSSALQPELRATSDHRFTRAATDHTDLDSGAQEKANGEAIAG